MWRVLFFNSVLLPIPKAVFIVYNDSLITRASHFRSDVQSLRF